MPVVDFPCDQSIPGIYVAIHTWFYQYLNQTLLDGVYNFYMGLITILKKSHLKSTAEYLNINIAVAFIKYSR